MNGCHECERVLNTGSTLNMSIASTQLCNFMSYLVIVKYLYTAIAFSNNLLFPTEEFILGYVFSTTNIIF